MFKKVKVETGLNLRAPMWETIILTVMALLFMFMLGWDDLAIKAEEDGKTEVKVINLKLGKPKTMMSKLYQIIP